MVIKKIIRLIAVISALTIIISCSDEEISNSDSAENILFNQKIIDNDDFFTGSHWNDPHVLYIGGEFVMYASSDIDWDGVVKIYRLISTDGKTWAITNSGNPVLEHSASGWDSHGIETPAVVFFNGEYHMFYTGYDVPYNYTAPDGNGAGDGDTIFDDDIASKHFRIGHATSPDGITWTKDPGNPIIAPTAEYAAPNLDFNQYAVGEPAPVVFNNKIYLYFTALGADSALGTTWQTIGLVTSSDGDSWSTSARTLTPVLTQYPRTTGNEYIGFSTPNAIVLDNKIHIYCDVVLNSPWTQVAIHHAYSSEGETGWIHDSAPLLEQSNYSWTASEIRSPSALEYNNNLYLYFAGHYLDGGNPILSIGLIIYDASGSLIQSPRFYMQQE
ncbi:MAG: hypothetical protein CVV49_15550 [Spirochaetae bacterium HGW-Spirochaetae-5]|nr:MAG: hypothetical protein CVV49_15550 [Spirochaetae bacterium HGW-Spirochaetae-5]